MSKFMNEGAIVVAERTWKASMPFCTVAQAAEIME